ncbi:class I SAM-dependent methyltransferase [Candidatus Curtissbacteria bacterium]|nr:class I SAM-dependent methyltransferase [Candidatus Curtissbacteria bacterium]
MNFFYLVRRLYAGLGRKNLWIDVGAGEGAFLASVEAKRRIGVEASPVARKILAEKKLEVIGERQFLKSQGLGADVISFWHVLEHTDEPWEYLAAVWRNLRKGGRLIVGVPNIDSLEFDLFGRHWFHLAPSYHIWHFSLRSLKILLERQNFKIEMVDFWSVEHQLAGIIQTLVNWSSGTINILHRLVRRNAYMGSVPLAGWFWSFFFLSLGLPLVLFLWTCGSLSGRPGTIVVVAKKI